MHSKSLSSLIIIHGIINKVLYFCNNLQQKNYDEDSEDEGWVGIKII